MANTGKAERDGYIDITPTWSGALNIYIAVLQNGTVEGVKMATEELRKMARLADAFVAYINNNTEAESK